VNDLYFPAFETGGRIVEVDIIFKKPRIPRAFGSVARIYNAWVRSGGYYGASGAYNFNRFGGDNAYGTNCRHAVRPAPHLFAENLLQTIPEFGSFKNDRTD
jgi:hypothetical protein